MIINLLGVLCIALIIWWFWLYKPESIILESNQSLIVLESGIYSPAHLTVQANKPTRLTFLRKDASPCAESVLIPDLDISQVLPLDKLTSVQLPALKAGEYPFHCQMQMYRGVITVVETEKAL